MDKFVLQDHYLFLKSVRICKREGAQAAQIAFYSAVATSRIVVSVLRTWTQLLILDQSI